MFNTTENINTAAIINAIKEAQENAEVAPAFKRQWVGNEYTDDDIVGSSIDAANWGSYEVSSSYEITDEELVIALNFTDDELSHDFKAGVATFLYETLDVCSYSSPLTVEEAEELAAADNETWADGGRDSFVDSSLNLISDGQDAIITALVEQLGEGFTVEAVAPAVRFKVSYTASQPFTAALYLEEWELSFAEEAA